ncbi:unnamed protein product [Eruca vesicaria subsp. sativa]|uniref:Protein kinase domain-containing protein n=1 Tax=Eruca vesicaria subsp. sativa TaxID=29727 RepID=A0ABC8KSX4_ERUVS|nr:unnamed protein product [Eruca vesicaria subsp. sativa]CAH8361745.1 unnamed protein product [Eruca vesicaria subsp. sativa]
MIREDNNGSSSSSLEFVSFLGRGGFGSVSLMRDSKHGLYAEKSSPMDFIQSLKKEHRIMLRFRNHPRIIQTTSPNFHVGIDRCYINMEFASKGSLHDVISKFRGRRMPEIMVARAALMILQGLEALHSRGYVHCDLKPANLLLFPSESFGEPWDLKLADFGLSKEPKRTDSWCGGTPQYMPPEVLGPNGVEMVGPGVDMWSLGCVVLQMFGRSLPNKKMGDFYAWKIPRRVSPMATDFVTKCMEVQPSRRATATDLLEHPFVLRTTLIPLGTDDDQVSTKTWRFDLLRSIQKQQRQLLNYFKGC